MAYDKEQSIPTGAIKMGNGRVFEVVAQDVDVILLSYGYSEAMNRHVARVLAAALNAAADIADDEYKRLNG